MSVFSRKGNLGSFYDVSGSTGVFTRASTTFATVTNLNVTIQCRGNNRPVMIAIVGDNGGASSWVGVSSNLVDTNTIGLLRLKRDPGATITNIYIIKTQSPSNGPAHEIRIPGPVTWMNLPPVGQQTFTVEGAVQAGTGGLLAVNNMVLVAWEL